MARDACTDVTGFALMGHLAAMAAASAVDVEIIWDDLPVLPGLLQSLADGIVPGAIERNREASAESLVAGDGLDQTMLDLCFDPQTSGGLLIAVGPENVDSLIQRLHESGDVAAARIGQVCDRGTGQVRVSTSGKRSLPPARPVEKRKIQRSERRRPTTNIYSDIQFIQPIFIVTYNSYNQYL